jgi:tetratricopeptide (TPR) repeat protein
MARDRRLGFSCRSKGDQMKPTLLVFALAVTTNALSANLSDDSYRQGMAFAEAHRWSDAQSACLRGESLEPHDKRFPLELAGIAFKLGDLSKAKTLLRRALAIDSTDKYGNHVLGAICLLQGNLDEALHYWNRIDEPRVDEVLLDASPGSDATLLSLAIEIRSGSVLRSRDLELTRANLARLGVTTGQSIELIAQEEGRFNVRITAVSLKDGVNGGRVGRALPLVTSLPYQTVSLDYGTLLQSDVLFGTTLRWDPNKKLANARIAGLLKGDPRSKYSLFAEGRDEIWDVSTINAPGALASPFRLRTLTLGADLEHGVTGRLEWLNGLRLSFKDNSEIFNQAYPFLGKGAEFKQISGVRYVLPFPDKRLILTINATGELGWFSASSGAFSRLRSSAALQWKPLPKNDSYEITATVNAGKTFGQVPFDELFILGMERDNDLWLRGHVGTQDGRKGSAPLGKNYVLYQSDLSKTLYRSPFIKWQLGPFLDMGNASSVSGYFGSGGLLVDTGVQSKVRLFGGVSFLLVCGHSTRDGRTVFYTAVTR